jgi:tetratricopeptide (TPR) repeat protein
MTTEYNILYNGELAFQKGLTEINEKYEDNYWEVLPIEPLNIEEGKIDIPVYKKKSTKSKKAKEESKKLTSFELAEEKAVKAVQKHSMKIGKEERNRKIDDAYLLLGKSRYYTSRFVPALEAFNYVVKNYPEANLIDETTVWKAKTQIRMQYEDLAIESLDKLLEKEKLSKRILEDVYTTKALAYRQLDTVHLVIKNLRQAVVESEDPQKKARNLFILGQLYRQENRINNSQEAFQEIIDFKKAPYKYKMHAEIEKVKNFQIKGVPEDAIPQLQKLIEIRENRPYLDVLYYHLGTLEAQRGQEEVALEYYKESVHAKNAKNFQKGVSFEAAGDIHFENSDYFLASTFYDSVLQVSGTLNTKRIRKLSKKKQSLESVLVFEEIIQRNDSLWDIFEMSKEEQTAHFENYIERLKTEEKEVAEQKAFQEQLQEYESTGLASASSSIQSNSSKVEWYFYNTQTVNYGAQEFKKRWGARQSIDNWRWSDTRVVKKENSVVEVLQEKTTEVIPEKYKVAFYIDQLPTTISEIDSISKLRSITYYQLGLIYKEQFKEHELAAETLERLLEIFPEDKLVLGTNYHLFKTYEALNDPKAAYYSNIVVSRFPNSVFAQKILNPYQSVSSGINNKTPQGRYREIYLGYKSGDYAQTVHDISKALRTFEGTPIVPKLELLNAYALARVRGKESFKSALESIVLNYSNTEEGKKAKELLKMLK